ncbi:T9SS type A sorting domain-containing protein [Mariniflexile sp. AS56]|uniref:T9SS type A sorting domain-containing protein n=1 Tax=Mariniflexile sp. AS56 TaxID=3063957 RepID=UPI0026EF83FD|nr:T9SS type A sorting domain-containing protein [Mariniflexile sp. AS56]MDO7172492.1 T9SS type A sorting domain-containing protein [Mariniflexile sp. AS56]
MNQKKNVKRALLFYAFLFCLMAQAQTELYIAPSGSDSNNGTISSPLGTLIGARDKARLTGAKTVWIRGGRYDFDATCYLGAQDNGVTFSGYNNETVIFDGSKFVETQNFETVTEQSKIDKLNPTAVGNVKSYKITDPQIIELLTKPTAQISINDEMKTLARFPNVGFAHVNTSTVNTSQEVKNTTGTYDSPVGATFKMIESINIQKWNAEINRTKRVETNGYISAVWLKEINRIQSIDASGNVQFVDGTKYGLSNDVSKPKRFFVYNMLYELDEPGEWYFDTQDSNLYVWFDNPIDSDTTIGIWAGPQLFEVRDASDIIIKKMTVQNIGKGVNGDGAINIIGSSDNIVVAGVRFRFIAAPITAANIWHDVTNSSIQSCDFYDIPNSTRLYGGKVTSTSISYGNNKIENCHFTQIFSKDFYGKACGMNGAGNIFRNNVIHNMNGQPLTHAGVDHILELNEVFNVGIEEGDGGAFYTGNSIWSYGNTIKHNFVHHIMSVPELLGRAGFFSDDFDGGESIIENVLYKGGWEAIKMNKGAGHSVFKNVLLDCYTGIKNSDDSGSSYQTAMGYITNNNVLSNDKNNYIGRMLKAIGVPNWQSGLTVDNWSERAEPFWTDRYPYMKTVFNKYNENNTMRAFECRFYDNMFWSNNNNVSSGSTVTVSDSKNVDLNLFKDPDNLNFKFNEPRPAYAPDIPFDNIGLYLDQYRCAVPNKDIYRRNIKLRFDGQACHTSDNYSYSSINDRLYYNTGKMVYETIPCADVLPEIAEEHQYKFDLGSPNSKVFAGYTRLSNITSGINYGWVNTTSLRSEDRGSDSGVNDLNRDFIYSDDVKLFEARVLNGNWEVLITFGDKDLAHDNMQVKAEGNIIFNNVDTEPSKFFNKIADVDVLDGKLSLEFSDLGGSNSSWQATRIILTRKGEALSTDVQVLNSQIKTMPNPTNGNFEVLFALPLNQVSIDIYNMYSQLVSSNEYVIKNNKVQLDLKNKPDGVYLIHIKIDNIRSKTIKIIKK